MSNSSEDHVMQDEDGPSPVQTDPADAGQLRRQVGSALSWTMAGTILARLGQLLSGIVVARILVPSDYGLFAVAQVVLVVVATLNDLGLEQSLVRWPGDVDDIAPTAKTVILASSLVQFLFMFLAAPVLASLMNAPAATGIIRLLAVGIIINGLFAVPSGMLSRRFQQDRRTIADFAGFVIGTGLTVVFALLGLGVWGLAWGRMIGNASNGALHAWFARPGYRFGWHWPTAKALLGQGAPLASATLLTVFMLNVDTVTVGRLQGPLELGLYTMAFNLSSWPVSMFGVTVWRVSVPAFARLQDSPEQLRSAFLRAFSLLMAVTLPACMMLSLLAPSLIRMLYGSKWSAAAAPLAVLAGFAALRIFLQLMSDLLVATGRSQIWLALQLVWLAALVPALILGVHHAGITGAAWAHVLVAAILVVPMHLIAIRPFGLRVGALVSSAARPAAAAAAAGVGALATRWLIGTVGGAPDLYRFVAQSAAGFVLFAVVIAPMRHTARAVFRR